MVSGEAAGSVLASLFSWGVSACSSVSLVAGSCSNGVSSGEDISGLASCCLAGSSRNGLMPSSIAESALSAGSAIESWTGEAG